MAVSVANLEIDKYIHTLHHSRMIGRKPQPSLCYLDMDFAGEADALQKLI